MFELSNFSAIKLGIASPQKIREWSFGEVINSETINYRTQKPEKGGLFCERIFGPEKDYECSCGNYKRPRYKGVICDKCGVEVTSKTVRRERMGHVELATPVSHIWLFKINPSKIGVALDIKTKDLEQVLYYNRHIVLDPGKTDLEKKQILNDEEHLKLLDKYGDSSFKVGMGAEAIKKLLKEINLKKELDEIIKELKDAKKSKLAKLNKRRKVLGAFYKSGNKPEWMILEALPVLPPDLRPLVALESGKLAPTDLNELYRRLINRNLRLKKMIDAGVPDVIVRNEKRMLQEAVDAVFDNGKRGKVFAPGENNRELISIAAKLKGKKGRFRQNLLGKRVDYSARAVIVPGPELKLYQCGMPKKIALELFKPFIMREILKEEPNYNSSSAKKMVERQHPKIWRLLEKVVKDHPVLLNRQPTLHRLGIQAFEPILIEGNSIKLHPLVCPGYNADFDGDEMVFHLPLSFAARAEARMLMLASNNIVKPSDGKPILTPQQDMVLGIFYITMLNENSPGAGRVFLDEDEVLLAYGDKQVHTHSPIYIRKTGILNGQRYTKRIKTTPGRVILNAVIPQDLNYVDRKDKDTFLNYEIDFLVDKGVLGDIVERVYKTRGVTDTAKILDDIKDLGFKYATKSSITMSVFDMKIPESRDKILELAQEKADKNQKLYNRGLISLDEKLDKNIAIWTKAANHVQKEVYDNLDEYNPTKIVAASKARSNPSQLNQVSGTRGTMAVAGSRRIDIPVKSNYRQGLSSFEYFLSTRGGRKGLVDKSIKTADSGHLTRRLIDVAHEVTITEKDCFENKDVDIAGNHVSNLIVDDTPVASLYERIRGRYTAEDVIDPKTGELILGKNEYITDEMAKIIQDPDKIDELGLDQGFKEIKIRNVFSCKAEQGVCAHCYGRDMATNKMVEVGEPVGIISAQSIGEPGTQLTMRTFHTGGVASGVADITTGLPRVDELFEAQNPKGAATISEVSGIIKSIENAGRQKQIIITTSDGEDEITLDFGSEIIVEVGDEIEPGTPLSKGPLNPKDILRTKGVSSAQDYILSEILGVYVNQASNISTKHLEIIVKQMLRSVEVIDSGETELLPGIVSINAYDKANKKALKEGKKPARAKRVLLGITKSSLNSESFLSAASFQETPRILTEAAVAGRKDYLKGLKENVILGRLIPAGTGVKDYRKIKPKLIG